MEAFPASTPDANAALRIKDMHRRSSPTVAVTGLFINKIMYPPAPHRRRDTAPEGHVRACRAPISAQRCYPANPSYLRIRHPHIVVVTSSRRATVEDILSRNNAQIIDRPWCRVHSAQLVDFSACASTPSCSDPLLPHPRPPKTSVANRTRSAISRST